MADLTDTIVDAAQAPAEVTVDGLDVTAQPLPALIQADQYAKGQAAISGSNPQGGPRSGWGAGILRTAQVMPPGSV